MSTDISFIVSIFLSHTLVSPLKRSGEEPCHYLYFCFLLSFCFPSGRLLYSQLVTFHQWGVLYWCAAGAESDGQVQFWASGHKGWSGAMWVWVGLRTGDGRRQGRGRHAGGDGEVFIQAKVSTWTEIVTKAFADNVFFNFSSQWVKPNST